MDGIEATRRICGPTGVAGAWTHVGRLLSKAVCAGPAQLVIIAYRTGLVPG